ncbi:MAG: hypothetical protein PHU77_00055 [Simplicispira sp.]|nr:hypothetical protein [Simplicispira sp.]
MADLLESSTAQILYQPVPEVVLLEPLGTDDLLEVPTEHTLLQLGDDNTLLEPVETLVLLTEAIQGPPGPPGSGEGAALRLVARTNISGHRAVMATPLGAEHADPANAGAVIGVSKHAAVAGDLVGIATLSTLTEPTWTWTPGATVFFVADGLLTQTVPTAVSVMPIGTALTPTSLLINPLHAVFI